MNLKPSEMIRSNTIYNYLKNQSIEFLEEHNLSYCKACNGRGIMITQTNMWNGTDFCEECKGFGFQGLDFLNGFQISDSLYICKNCDGLGCSKCNEKGVVDWISHAMG